MDVTKPLVCDRPFGDPFDVTFVTQTSDGHILVTPKSKKAVDCDWIIFNTAGGFVRSSDGGGSAITLANKVTKKSLWQVPAHNAGAGQLYQDATDSCYATIRYDFEGDQLVGVELVKAGSVGKSELAKRVQS